MAGRLSCPSSVINQPHSLCPAGPGFTLRPHVGLHQRRKPEPHQHQAAPATVWTVIQINLETIKGLKKRFSSSPFPSWKPGRRTPARGGPCCCHVLVMGAAETYFSIKDMHASPRLGSLAI